MLYCTVHLAAVFLLFQRLTLVVFLLSFGKGDVNLGAPFAVYEHKRRHNSKANLLSSLQKFVYLALGKQQLAVALGLVVIVGTEKYGDMFMPFTQISPLCI